MKDVRNSMRVLLLLYFTFSLVPTIVAPPERSFPQRKPESLKDMLIREQIVQKDLQLPSGDVDSYPALLTHKTSHLLSEAKHMLSRIKNQRERRWVEEFVHRLVLLSYFLEKSADDNSSDNKQNFTEKENVHSSSRNLAPKSHPTQPSFNVPDLSTPNRNQEQEKEKVNMMLRYAVTLPQLNQVLPKAYHPTDGQLATEPELVHQLRNKKSEEDDELVRELEALSNIAAPNNKNATPPAFRTSTTELHKPMSSKTVEPLHSNTHEPITGTNEETTKALLMDEHNPVEHLHQNWMTTQPSKVEVNKSKVKKDTPHHTEPTPTLKDTHSEQLFYGANKHVWRPKPKQLYINNSLKSTHLSLAPMDQQMIAKKMRNISPNSPTSEALRLYHESIKDTIQKLQRQHENFLRKNPHPEVSKNSKERSSSVPIDQNQFLEYGNKYHSGHAFVHRGSGLAEKRPYSSSQNGHQKHSTAHGYQEMATQFTSKSFPNYKIDAELSDEMRRQMRDGKVIILSDSVVRSNFEPSLEKDKNGKISPHQVAVTQEKKGNHAQN